MLVILIFCVLLIFTKILNFNRDFIYMNYFNNPGLLHSNWIEKEIHFLITDFFHLTTALT